MTVAPELSEDDWKDQVVDYARLMRWLVHHCRPAQDSKGRWKTPIQGDPGFPDLVLVRSGHVLFVELKCDSEVMKLNQIAWRDRLIAAGQDWRCWRPKDWPEVQATLALHRYSSWREVENVATKGPML